MELKLFAPAKINLCLKVTGRREDGYHNLQSLFVALNLGDALNITARPSGLQIHCEQQDIPTDADSLLGRAFAFAAERFAYQEGLEICLKKQLPIGAGMGGGSSDAAAVVHAVEQITGKTLPVTAYADLAYQVGADVPFFHAVGAGCPRLQFESRDGRGHPAPTGSANAAWIQGVGEQVESCKILFSLYIILINPGIHISTPAVYQALGKPLTSFESLDSVPPSFESMASLLPFVTNDLESVVLKQYPPIQQLKTALLERGADAALMSGSGSTVFGLFSQAARRDDALEFLQSQYPDYWVCAAELI